MVYRTLGKTELSLSLIGFGASPLGDVFGKTDPAGSVRAVHNAVDAGINFFDVSPYYGLTLAEERLGKALLGIRNKVILATKCGRYGAADFDFSPGRVKRSIEESLVRLQTDYIDLFQVHDIEFGNADQIVNETIPALRSIQKSGKARFIGITGYPLDMLVSVAERQRVDAILSYCRYNLLVTDLDAQLAPFAKAHGIGLINASPLHMGLLSGSPIPDWHPAPAGVRRAAANVLQICRERGLDPVVVALRFSIDHPLVSSTLIGMSSPEQVETALQALDFEISPDLLLALHRCVSPVKDFVWPSGREENADRSACQNEEQLR